MEFLNKCVTWIGLPMSFLVVSSICGFIPQKIGSQEGDFWQKMVLSLSVGILMASCLGHQMPELQHLGIAAGIQDERVLMVLTVVFVFLGTQAMIFLNVVLGGHGHGHGPTSSGASRRPSGSEEARESEAAVEMQLIEGATSVQVDEEPAQVNEEPAQVNESARFLPIFLSLCFHSVMEGVPMGVAKNPWVMFLGLILHKATESIAVGSLVVRSSSRNRWLLAYAICTPLGFLAGAALSAINAVTTANTITSMILFGVNGVSVGVMMYMVFSELPKEVFHGSRKDILIRQAVAAIGLLSTLGLIVFFHDHHDDHHDHHHDDHCDHHHD